MKRYGNFPSLYTAINPSIREMSKPSFENPTDLKKWWHKLLGMHDKYPCVATLLTLPSDSLVINYIKSEYIQELDLLSGDQCLVLALSDLEINNITWEAAFDDQSFSGFSLEVAKYFDVSIMEFPALLLFRDIRSTEHYLVSLNGLNEYQIQQRLRWVFQTINMAVAEKQDPLLMLKAATSAVGIQNNFRSALQKTLDTAFETIIKTLTEAIIKPKP